jgi:hypothetical protein
LSVGVIAVMVALPFVQNALLAPYLRSGLDPPFHMRVFLTIALWLRIYRWLLTPATVITLFLVAAFTNDRH